MVSTCYSPIISLQSTHWEVESALFQPEARLSVYTATTRSQSYITCNEHVTASTAITLYISPYVKPSTMIASRGTPSGTAMKRCLLSRSGPNSVTTRRLQPHTNRLASLKDVRSLATVTDQHTTDSSEGALKGIKILDLSRVLAVSQLRSSN